MSLRSCPICGDNYIQCASLSQGAAHFGHIDWGCSLVADCVGTKYGTYPLCIILNCFSLLNSLLVSRLITLLPFYKFFNEYLRGELLAPIK